jgi:hypothetical protein
MSLGHGSRNLQWDLSVVSPRLYEDYLDWVENQNSSPSLGGEELTLLLQFAAILTAACYIFSRLSAIPTR